MMERYQRALEEIADRLARMEGVERLVAYGSRVRGDYRGDSDMDVLVIVRKKDRTLKDALLDLFYTFELERDLSFSLAILSRNEYAFNRKLGSPFVKSIEEEGIVLYDAERRRKEGPFEIPAR